MKVALAEERDRLPTIAGVGCADQAEKRRQLLAAVGVAGAEEAVGPNDGEPHRVLITAGHALGPTASLGPEQPGVGGNEQGAVLRIDAKAVDVDWTGILDYRG